MKNIFKSLVFALSLVAVALPSFAGAASEITLKNVTFLKAADVGGRIQVKAENSVIFVNYTLSGVGATKFIGTPAGMTSIVDWLPGDSVTITGGVTGYEGGVLVVKAATITYNQKDVKATSENLIIENVDVGNNLVSLSKKALKNYSLIQYDKVGRDGGPRLVGVGGIDKLSLGMTVSVVKVKRGTAVPVVTQIKKISDVQAVVRVLDVKNKNAEDFFINSFLEAPITLSVKNTVALQNSSDMLIYLKNTDEVKKSFNTKSVATFLPIKAGEFMAVAIKNTVSLNKKINVEFYTGQLVDGVLKDERRVVAVDVVVK